MTDWQRVIQWFKEHPGSSVQEVRFGLFISNVTGRMSDARKHGVEFIQWRDDKGIFRYRVVESHLAPLTGQQMGAFGS
jgi:hypothetical protein